MAQATHHTGHDSTAEQARQERRERAVAERCRRLQILDRQHAARRVAQDRRLDDALGSDRR